MVARTRLDLLLLKNPPAARAAKNYSAGSVFDDSGQRRLAEGMRGLRPASWAGRRQRSACHAAACRACGGLLSGHLRGGQHDRCGLRSCHLVAADYPAGPQPDG